MLIVNVIFILSGRITGWKEYILVYTGLSSIQNIVSCLLKLTSSSRYNGSWFEVIIFVILYALGIAIWKKRSFRDNVKLLVYGNSRTAI